MQFISKTIFTQFLAVVVVLAMTVQVNAYPVAEAEPGTLLGKRLLIS
jgi:hypothetical protein